MLMECQKCKGFMNPVPTVDIIAIKDIDKRPYVVLIKRKNPPLGWALPGGFVDYGESCETAAARELKEETGLTSKKLTQFKTFSDPDRDPRQHTMTTVFWGFVNGVPQAGDDASEFVFTFVGKRKDLRKGDIFIDDLELAFDHKRIIDLFFLRGTTL